MKNHVTILCRIAIATSMVSTSYSQEVSAEPIELTRLREQFSNRIEQEMKPWRDRYAQELQKLEDRLIKERKLTEALAVKKEKENYLGVDLTKKTEEVQAPDTVGEAQKEIIGSVWLLYGSDDKKRENLIDVYYFHNEKEVYLHSAKKRVAWVMKSKNEFALLLSSGELTAKVDFVDKTADTDYAGKSYIAYLSGKPPVK